MLASGYPMEEGSTTQGRTFLSVSVRTGAVVDEEVSARQRTCPQEYTLLTDVATSRKQFTNALGQNDGRKEFLTAYLGDTWGNLWRYGPDAELVTDLGCDQPLHFSPTVVQLDADDPNNPHGGDTYLVQVTNSSLDDDTESFGPSKMIILKESNASGHPQLDTAFGNQRVDHPVDRRHHQDVRRHRCHRRGVPHPAAGQRPAARHADWRCPRSTAPGSTSSRTGTCPRRAAAARAPPTSRCTTSRARTPKLKQAFKIADEPVLSPVIVGGKMMVSSSKGPVGIGRHGDDDDRQRQTTGYQHRRHLRNGRLERNPMKTLLDRINGRRRLGPARGERGAVLVVVLLVMVTLLSVGMLSIRLTGGNLNVASSMNLRQQALYCAQAGVERARAYLNLAPADDVHGFITRLLPSRGEALDDVPTALNEKGVPNGVGAVLRDGAGALVDVTYPPASFGRTGDNTASQMGNYTVWIRNDTADARRGNLTTDTNGAVVVRSRCVALDGRTSATVELTFFPRATGPLTFIDVECADTGKNVDDANTNTVHCSRAN